MEVREPAVTYGKQKLSIEEYLEMENASSEKHEYYKGEVFAMSGAKVTHNIITKNLLISLAIKLKRKSCQPFGSDQPNTYRSKYTFYLSGYFNYLRRYYYTKQ